MFGLVARTVYEHSMPSLIGREDGRCRPVVRLIDSPWRCRARCLLVFLVGGLLSCAMFPVSADFSFTPGDADRTADAGFYATWNASNRQELFKPGIKILFFGEGYGCDPNVRNGPVVAVGNPNFEDAARLTGVPLAADPGRMRWTPRVDEAGCHEVSVSGAGDSFVHINPDPDAGGFGLFTATGRAPEGRQDSFFRPIGRKGRGGSGINAHIEASFVSFRFDWQKGSVFRPWVAAEGKVGQPAALLRSTQSVKTFAVGSGSTGDGAVLTQAKQQLMVTFINPSCFHEMRGLKRLCQIQYLFNLGLYRSGVDDWDSLPLLQRADVFLDPGQGGMPVVRGVLGRHGRIVETTPSGAPIYASHGAQTQHDVFASLEFRMSISFEQLKNALSLAASKALGKETADTSSEDVKRLYGSRWRDSSQWVLLSIHVGQEVYNPSEVVPVYIGGSLHELSLETISLPSVESSGPILPVMQKDDG